MLRMIYNEDSINRIKDILVEREETISAAESVTAGHLQAAFSAGIDASKYFQGGITAYNIGQKTRHLHIDPIVGAKVNCVAATIAHTMAIEVGKMFSSDYGIAITGYASIVPEIKEEGLFAFFSLSYKGQVVLTERLTSEEKRPSEVQVFYAHTVIDKLLNFLDR